MGKLTQEWLHVKNIKSFESIAPYNLEKEKRYLDFFEKLISKKWVDPVGGIYFKVLASDDNIDNIISEIISRASQGEQKVAGKLLKALKDIEHGIADLQTVLEDDDLKKPYSLFLLLLRLNYRKGKLETDAQTFRSNLFEKDYIKYPSQVVLVGALYGYYTGYHNLRRFENVKYVDDLNISNDKEILNLFRLKLSHKDAFEKEAFNIIYNKVVESAYPSFPKIKINLKNQKESRKELIREVVAKENEIKTFKFIAVPQLGQHCYKLSINNGQSKFIKRFIDLIDTLSKKKITKVACLIIVLEFLKANQVQYTDVFNSAKLLYSNGQLEFGLDLNIAILTSRLEQHLEICKEPMKFTESLNSFASLLDGITNQNLIA